MQRDELVAYLQDKFGNKIELLEAGKVEPLFLLKNKDDLIEFCTTIKEDDTLWIDFLNNISGVDTGERFEIVYHVSSYRRKHRFDFKIHMEYENAEVDTVLNIWACANWHEREIWELYGIQIKNHPNLTRFLLPFEWDQGYPMRKTRIGIDSQSPACNDKNAVKNKENTDGFVLHEKERLLALVCFFQEFDQVILVNPPPPADLLSSDFSRL